MPKKNIYFRNEDMPVVEEAYQVLGEEEALGKIIADALKEKLNDINEVQEKVYKLQLLKQLDYASINEIVEYRMREYSPSIVSEAEKKALAAYIADPDHFDILYNWNDEDSQDYWQEWVWTYFWSGLDIALEEFNDTINYGNDKNWFEEAKELTKEGLKIIEKMKENKKTESREIEELIKEQDNE